MYAAYGDMAQMPGLMVDKTPSSQMFLELSNLCPGADCLFGLSGCELVDHRRPYICLAVTVMHLLLL